MVWHERPGVKFTLVESSDRLSVRRVRVVPPRRSGRPVPSKTFRLSWRAAGSVVPVESREARHA